MLRAWITCLIVASPGLHAQGFGPELLEVAGTLPGTTYATRIVVADLDTDGRPDLLVSADQGSGALPWFQQPDGSFVAGAVLGFVVPVAPSTIAVTDLDLDGLPDLVGYYPAWVRARLGTGSGQFGPVLPSSAPLSSSLAIAADFDADGAPDLLAGGKEPATGGQLWVATGLQDGTFSAFQLAATPRNPLQLLAADLDLDGDLDAVCVEGTGDVGLDAYAGALLNDGAAGFTKLSNVYHVGLSGALTVPVDLDADGVLDFAMWSTYDGKVRALLGQGAGHFQSQELVEPGGYVFGVACADMDTDGFLDIAANQVVPGQPDTSSLWVQRLVRLAPEGEPLSVPQGEGFTLAGANLDADGLPELVTPIRAPDGSEAADLVVYRNALGPVVDLGLGAAGGPTLVASGVPAPGEVLHLAWHGEGQVALVLGVANHPQLLGTGFLLPEPALVLFVATSGTLDGTWPAGVAEGTHVSVQGVGLGTAQPIPGNTLLFVAQP
jgi:hypothetical protein